MSETQEMKIEGLVKGIFDLRAKRDEIASKQKELLEETNAELEKVNQVYAMLEGELLDRMQKDGVKNYKTEHGTVSERINHSYKVEDFDTFAGHVIETGNIDMFQKSCTKEPVVAFVEEHGELPPGIGVYATRGLQVRSPTKKA